MRNPSYGLPVMEARSSGTLKNIEENDVLADSQVMLTGHPAGKHYRTRLPALGPGGAGFAFMRLSATLGLLHERETQSDALPR